MKRRRRSRRPSNAEENPFPLALALAAGAGLLAVGAGVYYVTKQATTNAALPPASTACAEAIAMAQVYLTPGSSTPANAANVIANACACAGLPSNSFRPVPAATQPKAGQVWIYVAKLPTGVTSASQLPTPSGWQSGTWKVSYIDTTSGFYIASGTWQGGSGTTSGIGVDAVLGFNG